MAYRAIPFHEGEEKMHAATKVPMRDNPMVPGLTARAAQQISMYSLMAIGTTDPKDDHRPWTTLWGDEPPMAQAIGAGGIIGIKSVVDASFDPVVNILLGTGQDGGNPIEIIQRLQSDNIMVSALSIGLLQRSRVKLFGKMVAGTCDEQANEMPYDEKLGRVGHLQLVLKIEQSLGNCPKYLNKKRIISHPNPQPVLVSEDVHLCDEAIELIEKADMFFVSSSHAYEDMDTNHRGGPPGFLRVQRPDKTSLTEGTVLVWPEYSGNNLYQTLGNLMTTPRAGLAIPDFETGDILYLSGDTEILLNEDANSVMSKTKLAVRFTTKRCRLVRDGLGFRGVPVEDATLGRSPYNPRVRYLTSERIEDFKKNYDAATSTSVTAKMIKKTKLTPTITKYRLSLSDPAIHGPWQPGQHVALDFSSELDLGYSHMRDDDPTSLNDDYIRTFTVASPPGSLGIHGEEFELIVRKKGSVTSWWSWQREGSTEIGVLGFAGSFKFENTDIAIDKRNDRKGVFVAAGSGITPLLGQRAVVKNLKVRWSVKVQDVGLVLDVLRSCSDETKAQMIVYLSGPDDNLDEETRQILAEVMSQESLGLKIERRRLQQEDLTALETQTDDWYLCTAPEMRKMIQSWLPDKTIVFENFDY